MNYVILGIFISIIVCGIVMERSKPLSYAIMVVMFILTCFSYDSNDYLVYTMVFMQPDTSPYEPLFNLFLRLGNMAGLDYDGYRIVVTAVCLLLINTTIQRFSTRPALAWAMFIIFPGWIITTLLRHMMALSVLIFGLRYLIEDKKGNTVKLLITVVVAALLHNSFWVFLFLIAAKYVRPLRLFWICAAVVAVTYVFGMTNFWFKIFQILPVSLGYIEKYMTNSYTNLNGIIYNVLRQCIIMFSGYLAVYMYRRKVGQGVSPDTPQAAFMDKVLAINNASLLILCMLFYTITANRMNHVIMLVNVIAWCIALSQYGRLKVIRLGGKLCIIGILVLLSVLACTIESPVLFEMVMKMHFETNEIINLFN